MPPKRKPSASESTLLPRKVKIQKKKQTTAQQKADTEKRLKWFQKYTDKDNSNVIPPDGCQKLFGDLGISLESITPIIFGWKMGASSMGYITKEEWIKTMETIGATTATDFKKILHEWETEVSKDDALFKQLYLFTFNYVKSKSQKSMEIEMAIALWHILLEHEYPISKSFVQFIQCQKEKKPVKVINKDQWSSLLDFCKAVPQDLSTYDSTSSWPVLFDDYVEWRQHQSIQINQYEAIATTSWIELGIIRVSIVGITVISILSGFGVVNAPFNTWALSRRHIKDQDLTVAEHAYHQTKEMIQEKRLLLEKIQNQDDISNKYKASVLHGGLFTRIASIIGADQSEVTSLQTEIEQLEGLAVSMKADLDELELGRAKSKFSRTWKGRMWGLVDKIFSIYCIYKLIITTVNVLLQRSNNSDIITRLLSMMMSHLDRNDVDFKIDPIFWSQQLSFWFAGILVFGSVRGFLKLLARALRVFMHKVTFSTSSILLFVAHMMGMYFLSSVLMMQMSLPPEYRYYLVLDASAGISDLIDA
ncbi:hypothetical protein [Parasitella parasitica]|uniref:DCUN1 domain-containing protein n=1 Tax=Parasitella parasitica TaxID=35722 RepID=A0A0B7N278_9FUNG|nr:hypothetical protein [Parasitella parasitica]